MECDSDPGEGVSGVWAGSSVGSTHSVSPANNVRPLPRNEISGFVRFPIGVFNS